MQTIAKPQAFNRIHPKNQGFLQDVMAGLKSSPKHLPCKYFYDQRGSELFDAICRLEEYYPTRTEMGIMAEYGKAMAEALGENCMLIELGSGSSWKTRILLNHLPGAKAYVPVDIAREHLEKTAKGLAADYPGVEIVPVCADFFGHFAIPVPKTPIKRRVVYFPGSTIGNFEAHEAELLLRRIAIWAGLDGGLLIGFDICADVDKLHAAYNDSQGITAAFNLNLLEHINRELDGSFSLNHFNHRATYDEPNRRVVMHLESLKRQDVYIAGEVFRFAEGESIRTEYSHKYDIAAFCHIAKQAGLILSDLWTDDGDLFAVGLFSVED
jgi:dimethylhistidine N-methyltransferase